MRKSVKRNIHFHLLDGVKRDHRVVVFLDEMEAAGEVAGKEFWLAAAECYMAQCAAAGERTRISRLIKLPGAVAMKNIMEKVDTRLANPEVTPKVDAPTVTPSEEPTATADSAPEVPAVTDTMLNHAMAASKAWA